MKLIGNILVGCLAAVAISGSLWAADVKVSRSDVLGGDLTKPTTTTAVMESLEVKLPPRAKVPEDMKQLVTEFRKQAESYVERRKELLKQIKGASTEDRERIKEQLRVTRQSFLDQTRDIRSDIAERIKELKTTIKENRPQAAGAGEAGGRRRHGGD